MSKKTKDIIFYCLAGVLVLAVGIAAVLEAVKGTGNLAVSIIIAIAAVGLLILSGIEVYGAVKTKEETKKCCCCNKEATTKQAVEEVKPVEEVVTVAKPAAKKASTKKYTTKKSSK